ncbi:putative Ig domain-containing protein [Pseudoalteromonas sp. A3]|uniref:YfaP family protein n=1 Tax=Pseudoalteromonas TaxID=53246 RepID=UPI000BBCC60C|nr:MULTISPECIES: putative Ig domain-containing protein [Pseudoalteromonas]MCW1718402.1 putative Ig domain-containing protein [Pseudoalteromonas sp. A3]
MENQFKLKPLLVLPLISVLTACGSSDSDSETAVVGVNSVPVITSQAVITATEDTQYTYDLVVQDDDSNLTYSLNSAPEGMTISSDGSIQWVPTEGVVSSGNVVAAVNDGVNDSVLQSFEIEVTPVNDSPVLTEVANQVVKSGDNFTFQINVTDPDDNAEYGDLNFTLTSAPEGMNIDQTGLLTYAASASETSSYVVTVSVSDGGEDGSVPSTTSFTLDEQYFLNISAVIKNYYTEDVIENATAYLTNGDEIVDEAVSNQDGIVSFSVQDIDMTSRMSVISDAEGFAEMGIGLNENQINLANNILLQPVHAELSFDPTVETQLSVEDTVLVELPANSLVRPDGTLVTGIVNAELTIINPAIDINLMPGDMITKSENGEIKPIESFGAITVTFKDTDGLDLNLIENAQAKINIPAVGQLEPTIPLYYFNENTGFWAEEGEAELISNSQGNFYTGMVSHFTTWNADRIYDTVFINGCIEDEEQNRIAGAQVNSEGRDYIGSSSAVTDENGMFSIPTKMNSTVLISSTVGAQSRTSSIETTDVDLNLGECIVLNEALTRIKLNWGLTPSDLDSHLWGPSNSDGGQFHIYYINREIVVNDVVMFLDVDDVTSYGPEVISIPEFALPGTYTYKVHNYSQTPDIDTDTAKVELIVNDRRYIFTPPSDGVDDMWYVFDLVVSESGNVDINEVNTFEPDYRFSSNVNPSSYSIPRVNLSSKAQSYELIYKDLVKGKYYSY